MGKQSQSKGAEIVNIQDVREYLLLRKQFEIAAAVPVAGFAIWTFFCEMSLKALEVMTNNAAIFKPAPAIAFPPQWIEDVTGKPNMVGDLDKNGHTVFASYKVEDPAQKYSDTDDGNRVFMLKVAKDRRTAEFFHGDTAANGGQVLELLLGEDGDFRVYAHYELESGVVGRHLPKTQDYIEEFFLQLIPAMNKQRGQVASKSAPSHLHLVN